MQRWFPVFAARPTRLHGSAVLSERLICIKQHTWLVFCFLHSLWAILLIMHRNLHCSDLIEFWESRTLSRSLCKKSDFAKGLWHLFFRKHNVVFLDRQVWMFASVLVLEERRRQQKVQNCGKLTELQVRIALPRVSLAERHLELRYTGHRNRHQVNEHPNLPVLEYDERMSLNLAREWTWSHCWRSRPLRL